MAVSRTRSRSPRAKSAAPSNDKSGRHDRSANLAYGYVAWEWFVVLTDYPPNQLQTGLFLSSGVALSTAGPAGALVSSTIVVSALIADYCAYSIYTLSDRLLVHGFGNRSR